MSSEAGSKPDYDPRLKVIHADMDAFFAAVEVLDDPSLRGKPLIIGHPGKRGVVSTASYEARKFGVHSALPSVTALRRCPEGVWRSPRPRRYAEVSKQILEVFRQFTPRVEPLSLDEAFLDVAGSLRLFGGAISIAEGIRRAVPAKTGGLTVSVGVAENMFLAKLASDLDKPDGVTVIPAGRAAEFLAPLPVEKLWGVGKQTAKRLHEIGLRKIGDLAAFGLEPLQRALGKRSGEHLFRLSQGRDGRHVATQHDAKSISTESTFSDDLHDAEEIDRFLFAASESVSATLRREKQRARVVQLKVRTGSFRTMTRSVTLGNPTDLAEVLYRHASELFASKVDLAGEGVRLLGVGGHSLLSTDAPRQATLFAAVDDPRQRATARLLDEIRDRHGRKAIVRGRLLSTDSQDAVHPGSNDPGRIRKQDLGRPEASEHDE